MSAMSANDAESSQSEDCYPPADCFLLDQTENAGKASPLDEAEPEKHEHEELHCLRCENANLVKRVQQLESQIEETRVGLIEIFNHKASSPAEAGFTSQRCSLSEASSQNRDTITAENLLMKELLLYLMPCYQQDASLDSKRHASRELSDDQHRFLLPQSSSSVCCTGTRKKRG